MIHLTIDGIPVEVEKGTTILQAARQIGVEIPTLCYLEDVLPDGSCRLCVVEVTNNGRTKFDTACTLRCSEGDEVQTMSEKVVAYRKDTLDLLLSDHRVHCFSCEANGDCTKSKHPLRPLTQSRPLLDGPFTASVSTIFPSFTRR